MGPYRKTAFATGGPIELIMMRNRTEMRMARWLDGEQASQVGEQVEAGRDSPSLH